MSVAASQTGQINAANPSSSTKGSVGIESVKNIIPRGIRQDMIPFLQDPSSKGVQVFSFRNKDKSNKFGILNIIPDDRGEFQNDIGMKLLASKFSDDGSKCIAASKQELFNHIPAIQIREYVQDTKLQLLAGLIGNIIEGCQAGASAGSKSPEAATNDSRTFSQKAISCVKQAWAVLKSTGNTLTDPNFWDGIIEAIKDSIQSGMDGVYKDDKYNRYVLQFVFCLYYRMIGSKTTNMYILPCNSNEFMSSLGSDGWNGPNEFGWWDSKNSLFGKAFGFVFDDNLKVVTQPLWRGSKASSGQQIQITMNLFNDTKQHAINNFIFVNTLVPQNMFLQYGIFQLPPSTYDIKMEGGGRWFMCSGKFECKNKGVVRDVDEDFVTELVNGHMNATINKKDVSYFVKNRLIKIPDIYEVTMTFVSLLPESYNQFLYRYAANNNITASDTSMYETPFYESEEFTQTAKNKLTEIVKAASQAAKKAETNKDVAKEAEKVTQQSGGASK